MTTENVELAQSEIGEGVKVERTDSPAGWKAGFTLFIPKDGSSETRQLLITPRQADEAKIDVFIFARNTLYRQFRVELNIAAQAAPPPEKKKNSVAIRAEVIHMPAMHTGLQPQHEWQPLPGDLKIIVQGQKAFTCMARRATATWTPKPIGTPTINRSPPRLMTSAAVPRRSHQVQQTTQ